MCVCVCVCVCVWGAEGVQSKKASMGGVWIFSGTTHCHF